jgi:hypothetical protein
MSRWKTLKAAEACPKCGMLGRIVNEVGQVRCGECGNRFGFPIKNNPRDIPLDAWAVRARNYTEDAEMLVGSWHETLFWFRRDGVVSGIVTHCQMVYKAMDVELIGASPDQKTPDGPLCDECFQLEEATNDNA